MKRNSGASSEVPLTSPLTKKFKSGRQEIMTSSAPFADEEHRMYIAVITEFAKPLANKNQVGILLKETLPSRRKWLSQTPYIARYVLC